MVIGEGQLYPAYNQNGTFIGILNGNTGTINLVTDENFPQANIMQDVTIMFYRTSTDEWIKVID